MINYEYDTPSEQVINNMIEVEFPEGPEEGFRKVKETLQRMGVPSRRENVLFQSAHILHKQGKYYICHFKELFALDGKQAELSEQDLGRRNLIVRYLKEWGLVTPKTDNWEHPMTQPRHLKVLRYQDKEKWTTEAKYNIGSKR